MSGIGFLSLVSITLFIFFAISLGLPIVILFFAMGGSQRKIQNDAHLLETACQINGVIADAQLVQDMRPMSQPLHYKYALQYTGENGVVYRAFLGINSAQPLPFAVGMPVVLRVFAQPLMSVPAEVMDTNRGTDGRLPGIIRFRLWNNVPVDETACVMLESDFMRVQETLQTRFHRATIARYVAVALMALFVLCIGALVMVFR